MKKKFHLFPLIFIGLFMAIIAISCDKEDDDDDGKSNGAEEENIVVTENGIDLVFVPGGTLTQGATDIGEANEKPAHPVTLSDFYIGKYEVTQKQWFDVVGAWPDLEPEEANGKGDNYPIYYVTWEDVQTFLTKLNEKSSGKTYRLPTEAEWEYASHGGQKSKGYLYSGSDNPGDIAIYYGTTGGSYAVGIKGANELGIHDMSGNAWEWTNDWYGPYSSEPQTNPQGPATGTERVTRGGNWINTPYGLRITARYKHVPESALKFLGFRIARSVE
jgi:formylglycine-generating enzyme required for sulfatase activity